MDAEDTQAENDTVHVLLARIFALPHGGVLEQCVASVAQPLAEHAQIVAAVLDYLRLELRSLGGGTMRSFRICIETSEKMIYEKSSIQRTPSFCI